jgi:hypothetical protein
MAAARFPDDVNIAGDLTIGGEIKPLRPRSSLEQDNNAVYAIPMESWRVWDAMATNLPGTAAADDLALVGGTFGTGCPSIQTGDLKNAGATTRYARALWQLPPEYVAGQSVTIRLSAGMVTTVASTAATVDLEVYQSARDTLKTGSDLCATAAQSINNLTFADKDFEITATGLEPGDWLDIRLAITVNDTGTGTAVIGCVGAAEPLLDIKG